MYSEFFTSSNCNRRRSSCTKNEITKARKAEAVQKARAYIGLLWASDEQRKPVPVPQISEIVIIIPLVMASGTGKASSTLKVKAMLEMGITEKPISSITKLSSIVFFKGRVPKWRAVVMIVRPLTTVTSF